MVGLCLPLPALQVLTAILHLRSIASWGVASFCPTHQRSPRQWSRSAAGAGTHARAPYSTTKHGGHRSPSRTALSSRPLGQGNDGDIGMDGRESELTPPVIAEMIEVSFIQSCLQLSRGYVDVLKLFIAAVKAGHEQGLSLADLLRLVEECPVNSAGRELAREERGLRLEWMGVIYETLNALDPDSRVESYVVGENDTGASVERISDVVGGMLAVRNELQLEERETGGLRDATVALTQLNVEGVLERCPSLSELNESMSDPMEKAILTNDIRLAIMMFRVLEEERACIQDGNGGPAGSRSDQRPVPRPPIPGTNA